MTRRPHPAAGRPGAGTGTPTRTCTQARPRAHARATQRGAALLLAMLILTLVATLASGMLWQQWRGIEIESAERTRAQGSWLLNGALDWARLILREDARNGGSDHLGEPWALPLAESRLSTFLAADKNNTVDDEGPEAFLSGRIFDAQSRLNLQNLIGEEEAEALKDLQALQRLCQATGQTADTADRIARGLREASAALDEVDASQPADKAAANAMLMPRRVEQLVWLGIDPLAVQALRPYIDLLPVRTTVNVNTAPPEVLMAAIAGLDRGSAERVVQMRARKPFETLEDLKAALPPALSPDAKYVGVNSSFFEVQGQLRFEQHLLRERSLVQRKGLDMVVLRRDRVGPLDP